VPEWLRERIANPLFVSSILTVISNQTTKDIMSDAKYTIFVQEQKNLRVLHAERRKLIKKASRLTRGGWGPLARLCWTEIQTLENQISVSEKRLLALTGDI
jgi:hypothetical protein